MTCKLITLWKDIYKKLACTWACNLLKLWMSKRFSFSLSYFCPVSLYRHLFTFQIELNFQWHIHFDTQTQTISPFYLSTLCLSPSFFHSVSIHVEIIFRSYGNTLPSMTTCTSSAIACIPFTDRIFLFHWSYSNGRPCY